MMKIEWRDAWVNTLIDAGFNARTAKDTYQAIYGQDDPDTTKNPVHEARVAMNNLKADAD